MRCFGLISTMHERGGWEMLSIEEGKLLPGTWERALGEGVTFLSSYHMVSPEQSGSTESGVSAPMSL